MDCLFCKIGNKELSSEMIYEDGHAFAILDITPRAPGHVMVIPKVHAANLLELPEEEVGPVFQAVKKVEAHMKEILGPDGFTIGINHGEASGQTVKHLHIHILPRYAGDKGGSIHSVVNNPGEVDLKEMAARLRMG